MAKTKEQKPVSELTKDIVKNYSFDDKLSLYTELGEDLKAITNEMKRQVEQADSVLKVNGGERK